MSTGLLGFETIEERQAGVDGVYLGVAVELLAQVSACLASFGTSMASARRLRRRCSWARSCISGLEAAYRHRQLGVMLDAEQVVGKMLDGWAKLIDEESITFDSAADEQALRQQACDLVKAYLAYAPPDEKPLAVEVALEAPLVDPDTGEDLGMPLVGVIDLVLDYEAGPLIVRLQDGGTKQRADGDHRTRSSLPATRTCSGSHNGGRNRGWKSGR